MKKKNLIYLLLGLLGVGILWAFAGNDEPKTPNYIKTIRGLGYKFIGE